METIGIGAGLAALAFWGFIAIVAVTVWDGIRKREAQHKTLRRLIESGQPLDQQLMEKLSLAGDSANARPDGDFLLPRCGCCQWRWAWAYLPWCWAAPSLRR